MLPMVDKQLCTQSLVLPKERRCVKTEDLNWRGDILTTNKRTAFFLLDQLSITLICVPSYDRSYNVYLFPYWFEIGYFSVTTRI